MLNSVELPYEKGGSAERTRSVTIVGMWKKRVILKPVCNYSSNFMEEIWKLTAGIANLDTGLTNVNRDDLSHFSFFPKGESYKSKI